MNVIGSRPDGWWRDRERAIARLVGQVDRWAEHADERVTVMLEHEPREEVVAERVEVAWAPDRGADAADREILRRLPDWLAEDEVVVVTSDRDLRANPGPPAPRWFPVVPSGPSSTRSDPRSRPGR